MRLDYYHTGNAKQEMFSVDRVVIEPLEWPGKPRQDRSTARTSASTCSRCSDPERTRAVLARLRLDLRRMGNDRRSEDHEPHVSRVAALSRRRTRPVRVVIRKRDAQNRVSGCLDRRRSIPKDMFVDTVVAACARPADRDREERRSGGQGGLPAPGRRLHRRRARQVRARRAADGRDPVRHVAVQGAAARFQRLGARAGRRRVGHLAALDRHPSRLAARRDLRRVRLRALRADVRQPGACARSRRSRRTSSSRF